MKALRRHPLYLLAKGLFVAACGFLSPLAMTYLYVVSGQPWTAGRVVALLLTTAAGIVVGFLVGRRALDAWHTRGTISDTPA